MSESDIERGYYMVRAKNQNPDEFACFFENNVVAIGWSRVDIRELSSKAEVDDAMSKAYGSFWSEAYPSVRGRRENEILRFNGIEEGDRILAPYHSSVALATATSDHRYDPETGVDLANQIIVSYVQDANGDLLTVSRSDLTEALQRRLRVRGSTVSDLGEFAEEIERLFQAEGVFTWKAHHRKEEEKRREQFRDTLLEHLRDGKVHVEGGGLGLEDLVAELLRHEGYDEVSLLAKQTFEGSGDADVQATRADHDLVLVTTGTVNADVQEKAEQVNIEVLDGGDLIDWLLDHVEALSPRTRRALGISEVPELMSAKSDATA